MVLASAEPAEVQLAFNHTWHVPFRWASDPDGELLARPLDAWDDGASIFRPVVVGIAPTAARSTARCPGTSVTARTTSRS